MRFIPFCLLLLLSPVASAAPLPAFEGTLTQTQNGATARAKIAWQPPDTLLVQIERNDASGIPAQTILANGDQTLLFAPSSKRTRRLPFNIAKSWWRGSSLSSGGPANFLFAGTAFPGLTSADIVLRRNDVLFGGGGQEAYYAAAKTPVGRFAAQIATTATSRVEKDRTGNTVLDAKITTGEGGLPTGAQVTAAGETTSFTYDLKPTTTPIGTVEIPTAVIEEDQLLAPSTYAGDGASPLFNKGAALALNEDYPAAFTALGAAARSAPTASAPLIATFELALSLRDDELAATVLARMDTLGLDPLETQPRRARLALLRRDYKGALAAFRAASTAAPQNLSLRLLEAEALRSSSDIEAARTIYRGILAEKTPQEDAQVSAAENLALAAMPEEFAALLESVPNDTPAQKLARSLVQLRDKKTPEVADFTSDALQVSLALGFESAGRDEDAANAWQTIETRGNDARKNRARAHLMTLAARRGDAPVSIGYWRAWNATLGSLPEQVQARAAFFDAWQKAFRSEALQSVLSNRATATAATEDDLRLYLAYLELYGSAADIDSTVATALTRFPKSAYWLGKRAEARVGDAMATRGNDPGIARREQLFAEALKLLDEAIAAAPEEPFYRFQKALVATQRGSKSGGVIDATIASRNRAAAKKETAALLAELPGDPDAMISAALQNLSFEGDATAREAINLATRALDTAPGDGDRHVLVWAARQALATAYRRLNQNDLAAQQWEMLLIGARAPDEQGALAANYFGLFEKAGDTAAAAHLLARIAGQNWAYSDARATLDALSLRYAASPMAGAVVKALDTADDGASALAMATLAQKQTEVAERLLQTPDAPPAADANLDRANRDLGLALGKLKGIADGPNRLLAARAAAFLAEWASLAVEERLGLLRRAIELEPRDASLRFALVGALSGDEAKKERDIAAKVLDFDTETRRQLSSATRNAGDVALALQLGEEALAEAARAPEVTTNTFQRLAFSVARTAFVGNQSTRATELYNGLSLPQWNPIDRAAALLALSRNYKEAGKEAEVTRINAKVAALKLEAPEIDAAITFADQVEN